MPIVTTKSLKSKTGLSLPTIRAAIKAAGIAADTTGNYDEAAALAAIKAQVDPARTAGHAVGGKGEVAEASGNATRGSLNTYADARAVSERYRAEKLSLEVRRSSGGLVERAAVERAGVMLFTQVRVALMAVGSKVAPKLIGVTEALDVQRVVEDGIREALTVLANEQAAIAEILS